MTTSFIKIYFKIFITCAGILLFAAQNTYANRAYPEKIVDKTRTFNHYTFVTTHNSWDHSDQRMSLAEQLDRGVRGFHVNLASWSESNIVSLLHAINNHMNKDPEAVVTIFLDGGIERAIFARAFSGAAALKGRIFNPTRWNGFREWPTLQQMLNANQRLIMIVRNPILYNHTNDGLYFFPAEQMMVESREHLTGSDHRSCGNYYGNTIPLSTRLSSNPLTPGWTRLFMMHHRHGGNASWNEAGDDNELGGPKGILPRVDNNCRPEAGRDPNYIGVKFAQQGDVLEYVEMKNNGGVIAYEGNSATQSLVCTFTLAFPRSFNLKHSDTVRLGCENDEMRSFLLVNVKRGQAVEFYDDPRWEKKMMTTQSSK